MSEAETEQLHVVGAQVGELSRIANGADVAPIVTRFYLIAETIDEDGQRGLEAFFPGDVSVWDAIGMLRFELEVELRKVEHRAD